MAKLNDVLIGLTVLAENGYGDECCVSSEYGNIYVKALPLSPEDERKMRDAGWEYSDNFTSWYREA